MDNSLDNFLTTCVNAATMGLSKSFFNFQVVQNSVRLGCEQSTFSVDNSLNNFLTTCANTMLAGLARRCSLNDMFALGQNPEPESISRQLALRLCALKIKERVHLSSRFHT